MVNIRHQNKSRNTFLFFAGMILASSILVYQILLSPFVFGSILKSLVKVNTKSQLQLKVIRSSILYGFEFEGIKLSEKNNQKPLFTARRLHASWFLPSILVGHVGIREFRLESPRFFIHRINGRWNWNSFYKMGSAKKEEGNVPDIIPLILEFRVYLKVLIENMSVVFSDTDNLGTKQKQNSFALDHIDLHLALLTKPFSEIPLSPQIFSIFDSVIFALNPTRPILVEFNGERKIKGALGTKIMLLLDSGRGKIKRREFALQLDVDTSKLGMYSQAGHLLGFSGLKLAVDSSFDALHDQLFVHKFQLHHREQKWLSLQARIDQVSIPERKLLLKINRSKISLGRIEKLIGILGNNSSTTPIIGGAIDIKSIQLAGRIDRLEIRGGLQVKNAFIQKGRGHNLDYLDLDFVSGFDLSVFVPQQYRPINVMNKTHLAFDFIRHLEIPTLKIVYNKAHLDANATLKLGSRLHSSIKVKGFSLAKYFSNKAQGVGSLDLELNTPLDFSRLDFRGNLNILNTRYYIKRSRSGIQNLKLQIAGQLDFKKGIALNSDHLILRIFSSKGRQLMYLKSALDMKFTGVQDYNVNIERLSLNMPELYPLLPGSLKHDLKPVYKYLSKGIAFKSNTHLKFSKNYFYADGKTRIEVPYLKLMDLDIEYSLVQKEKDLKINKLQVVALRGALEGMVSGHIDKINKKAMQPDVSVYLKIAQSKFLNVHPDMKLLGKVAITAQINSKKVDGKIEIKSLDLDFKTRKCSIPSIGKKCKSYYLRNMNFELPFVYNRNFVKKMRLSANPAREYLQKNIRFRRSNLQVKSFASNFTPQGKFIQDRFYYIGSPGKRQKNGLQGNVIYKKNVVIVNNLLLNLYKYYMEEGQGYWKESGDITGSDMYFNIGNLKPKNMEAGMRLQIKDLDLEPFMPESQGTYDGIISADFNGTVSSFVSPLYHTNAYFSIFKISQDFSGFVTRVMLPAKVVALIVRNTLEIPRINVELKNGLVYTSIKVKRARLFPGLFVAPGSDEIKQERMPLANFLEKARREVKPLPKEVRRVEK